LLTFENFTQNCQLIDLHVIDVFLPSEPHKKYGILLTFCSNLNVDKRVARRE
jgi:hypothetical protein